MILPGEKNQQDALILSSDLRVLLSVIVSVLRERRRILSRLITHFFSSHNSFCFRTDQNRLLMYHDGSKILDLLQVCVLSSICLGVL